MSVLVIALTVLMIFFGIGVLLVVAMFVETRRNASPGRTPNPQKPATSQRRPAA